MVNNFSVNGVPGSNYGVFLTQNGYKDIFAYPSVKNIEIVEWEDEDCEEADLSDVKIDSRRISLTFGYTSRDGLKRFLQSIQTEAPQSFTFSEVGINVNLRLTSAGSLDRLNNVGTITLHFTEDSPVIPSDIELEDFTFAGSNVTQRGYYINDIDLARLGCWVLDGTDQSLEEADTIKPNLVIESESISGQTYLKRTSESNQPIASRDFQVRILINDTIDNAVSFWKALYSAISSPGGQIIKADNINYPCYYKSASVSRFDVVNKRGWLEMTLNFRLTARPYKDNSNN